MALRLDHLVILVRDLNGAIRDYGTLGFAVTPGGEHADGLTRNALIPFSDGTYLELVTFTDPANPRDNVWNWRPLLDSGGGLIDHCLASEDLASDVRRLREIGLIIDGPHEGGRTLPDGSEIRWSSASIRQSGRALPFLIEDLTPREARVPAAPRHPNGALGISKLRISADARDAEVYAAMIESKEAAETLRLGSCALDLIPNSDTGSRLGPMAARLRAERGATGELDPALTHGASLRLGG